MATEQIVIVGAGGHAKVVLDALLASGVQRTRIIVMDDAPALRGREILGFPIQVPVAPAAVAALSFHVAIGEGARREQLSRALTAAGGTQASVVHPAATIAASAVLGAGAFIAARAVVGPAVTIGPGAIVNHGAVVDHDSTVGAYAHIAPNAVLGGAACVGARTLIGAGAAVLPGQSVGDDAVIGAGAVVVRDVPGGKIWIGVPAREQQRK